MLYILNNIKLLLIESPFVLNMDMDLCDVIGKQAEPRIRKKAKYRAWWLPATWNWRRIHQLMIIVQKTRRPNGRIENKQNMIE